MLPLNAPYNIAEELLNKTSFVMEKNLSIALFTIPELRTVLRQEIEGYFEKNEIAVEKDKLLTIEEAAEFLNLAKPTIYRLVSERNIPHNKKGKRLYFSKERLTEWVESGEVRTQAQIKKEVNNG